MLLFGGDFDFDSIQTQITQFEQQSLAEDFWDNPPQAEKVLTQLSKLKELYLPWKTLQEQCNDAEMYLELSLEADTSEGLIESEELYREAAKTYENLRFQSVLTKPYDSASAYLQVHSGAGGLDASDWTGMLFRMYLRWAELRRYTTKTLEYVEDEGGVKSATIFIEGSYAFGYLQSEIGIHRLVRISPFDKNSRRHTSFASVYASPEIQDDIEIDIKNEDIRIDTYRASGAGGQHVNKTDSAVRITHLETGIVVQCQNERSQSKNKSTAMNILKSRLYNHLQQQREAERDKQSAEKLQIAWGSQIRSYVFHPYTMVKDHRSGLQIGNPQTCLDGNIDTFIQAYLDLKIK